MPNYNKLFRANTAVIDRSGASSWELCAAGWTRGRYELATLAAARAVGQLLLLVGDGDDSSASSACLPAS